MFDLFFNRKTMQPDIDFRILHLWPDDILVVSTSQTMVADSVESIKKGLREILGDPQRKIIILDKGITLDVLRTREEVRCDDGNDFAEAIGKRNL